MKKMLVLIVGCMLVLSSCNNANTAQTVNGDGCCVSKKDSMELILNIPLKIKPEFVTAYKEVFEKCQAETLKEKACLDYALFQSYTDSTEFHLFERWSDKPGHLAHMQTGHFKIYKEESQDFYDTPKTKMIETYVCPCVNK